MNAGILESYRAAARRARTKFGENFRSVISVNTSRKRQNAVGYEVTKKCLERLREVTKEKIGFFDLNKIGSIAYDGVAPFSRVSNVLNGGLQFNDRDLVENDGRLVQPIAAP